MDLGDWMVAVMTLAAVSFLVWLELHSRRSRRRGEQKGAGTPDAAVEPGKHNPKE